MSNQKHQTFINLVAAECAMVLSEKTSPSTDLREKLMVAFATAKHHFMVTDKDIQMMGALCAVYDTLSDDDKATLKENIDALKQVNDAMNAAKKGEEFDLTKIITPKTPLGIIRLWHEAP